MLIRLTSNNPNLSYVINKNPASPPRVSGIRQGHLYSWYHNNDYMMKFIDGPDELSFPDYKNQCFEYLAASKFVHPEIPLNIFDFLLRKLDNKYDTEFEHSIEIYHLRIKNKTITTLEKYSDNINVIFTPLKHWEKYYSVKISLTGTISDLLDYTSLLCMLVCLDNREFINLPDERTLKFFKMLSRFDCHYFVRYLFKTNLVKNNIKRFELVKSYLNASETTEYNICAFNNYESRVRFVSQNVHTENLLDIGCGEGRYLTRFASKIKNYVGIDENIEMIEKCLNKAKKRDIKNATLCPSIDLFLKSPYSDDEYTVLLVEVIEHIEKDEEFLSKILNNINWSKIVLTTPNKTFNENYRIESLRHEEHIREYDLNSLSELLNIVIDNKPYSFDIYDIGDLVNGEPTTFGVTINKNEIKI